MLVSFLVTGIVTFVIGAVMVIQCLAKGTFAESQLIWVNLAYAQWILYGAVCILGLYGGFGSVNDGGNECLAQMKIMALMSGGRGRRGLLRRMVKALPVMKIEFGGANFIEKLTPFVYMEFAFKSVIDVLLLTKQ